MIAAYDSSGTLDKWSDGEVSGSVPSDGKVIFAVTGYPDKTFIGSHLEAADYSLYVLFNSVSFQQDSMSVTETDQNQIVTITLDISSPTSLDCAYEFTIQTVADSAAVGFDFIALNDTHTGALSGFTYSFELEILGDTLTEGDEIFFVDLIPRSGWQLGPPQRLTITIIDNAAPSCRSFSGSCSECLRAEEFECAWCSKSGYCGAIGGIDGCPDMQLGCVESSLTTETIQENEEAFLNIDALFVVPGETESTDVRTSESFDVKTQTNFAQCVVELESFGLERSVGFETKSKMVRNLCCLDHSHQSNISEWVNNSNELHLGSDS